MRLISVCLSAVALACAFTGDAWAAPGPLVAVGYASDGALQQALDRYPGVVVRRYEPLRVAQVRPAGSGFAAAVRRLPGIRYVERVQPRRSASEPALLGSSLGQPYEWQFQAAHADTVPASVLRAASAVTVAVVDTGADVSAPDLAAKAPHTHNVLTGSTDVRDLNGHGTFVASLAAGSTTNGDGIAGFGGDAKLLVLKASGPDGTLTDLDEANAIVYAVDHGARVVNLSVGGTETSATERRAVDYATSRGVLLVAAAGNEYTDGNPVEYPAALLQPPGSNGRGGVGLSVAASTTSGSRAYFSNTGSHLSLAAPGEDVFGAIASTSSLDAFPRVSLPGSTTGSYGFGSGTSFAAPEVAGAAALVMAANPLLRSDEVAAILKETATGRGAWSPVLGYGVLDVGAAVARAQGRPSVSLVGVKTKRRVRLTWTGFGGTSYRLVVSIDGGRARVLLDSTTRTMTIFRLQRAHRYRFTVTALDATGTDSATATYAVRS